MALYKPSLAFKSLLESVDDDKINHSQEFLSYRDLIYIYHTHKPTKSLLDLVKMTTLHLPKPPTQTVPKSPEYLALMAKLRREAQEKEYIGLTKPKLEHKTLYDDTLDDIDDIKTISQMQKELKSNLTTIVNILISVASVVYAIWYWTNTSWPLTLGQRVLLCVFFGILVLVAEVVVYMGYLNKIEEAKIRERTTVEIKKVIKQL